MSTDLVAVRNAVNKVTTGKQVNEDSWMTMWCNTNWGDLLQPAPLSIALLGSILIIASSTDDFSLVGAPAEGTVAVEWEYAKFPDSFKASLQQMVGEGYTAFEGAHHNMTRIQNAASQMPDEIKNAVKLILQGSPEEVGMLLGTQINSVLALSKICMSAASKCEESFKGIAGLAQELVLACTHKVGTDQQKMEANRVHLAVLKIQKEQEEIAVKQAKENHELMKSSFIKAEDDFHEAVENVPSGWDLVGMQVVESLTNLAVSAGNAAISAYTLRSQAMEAGLGAFKNSSLGGGNKGAANVAAPPAPAAAAPNGINTQKNPAALTDPGLLNARKVLDMANAMQQLVEGGPGGKPDWQMIRGKDASGNGGEYVRAQLETTKKRLDPSKPISMQLDTFISTALRIITTIINVGKSVGASDDALDKEKPKIDQLISDLQELVTSTNLLLQQTGVPAVGPATPPAPASTTGSAAKLAVETAKFQVDQTRANLEASRKSFDAASERLADGQKSITKTIGEMTSLEITNASLEKLLPVLKKAVGAFTTLRAQFSQLLQFFQSVASLLQDVMGPSVSRWANTMNQAVSLGGVSVRDFTRQLIYSQMMVPLKVSMLAEKISGTYIMVSDRYILPAQREVGHMLQFADSEGAAGQAALNLKLKKSQLALQAAATTASNGIAELVATEQKKFSTAINTRITSIETACKTVLPAITQGIPENIKKITEGHVEDVKTTKAASAASNPMFDIDDVM